MQIHALWCHPRSMSTAVERIMRERGDLEVLHEPFMYDYYISGDREKFTGFAPEADHPVTYEGIRAMILDKAAAGPVFLKDMGYYVADALPSDPGFARQMTHGFLVRDPAEAVVSYAKRQRDFTCEEVGLEALWRLYASLKDQGCTCHVLSSAAIRSDPAAAMAAYWSAIGLADCPEALRWDAKVPEGWRAVETWHREVLETSEILPPDTGRDAEAELAALGAPFTDYVAHHRPFHELLLAEHQK